jgi:hypothetical protein
MWKAINGYDYEVSDAGEVRNSKTGRILKSSSNGYGYQRLSLCKDGKINHCYVHRLVAETFMDNPRNLNEVDHINNNRNDNRVINLQWVTRSQNLQNTSISKTNTSGVKGVTWVRNRDRWQAQIQIDGIHIHLGYFENLEDARQARLQKVSEVFTNAHISEKMV